MNKNKSCDLILNIYIALQTKPELGEFIHQFLLFAQTIENNLIYNVILFVSLSVLIWRDPKLSQQSNRSRSNLLLKTTIEKANKIQWKY